jgi:integrase
VLNAEDGAVGSIAEALELCRQGETQLREWLDVSPTDPDYLFLQASIDRVGGCDLSELYAEDELLQTRAPGFEGEGLATALFSHQAEPPHTDYEDLPGVGASKPHRQPDHCYEVNFATPSALLEDWCLQDLTDWLLLLEEDIVTIADYDFEARQTRPDPFVAGQDCFVKEARGCIWDLRRAREGVIEPLNLRSPLHSQLDLDYIDTTLPGWRDQRLISYLHDGVHFEFDMPLQIVLHPHLFSVWHGFASLQKEARRLQGQSYQTQWSELFDLVPFMPIWILGHGSTERKYEPNRHRSTTEAGAPRMDMFDTEGKPVISINERSRAYNHPPELKPTPAEFAQDIATLNSAIAHAREMCPSGLLLVFIMTDDVADYFMHLATAPELWWYSTYAILTQDGDPPSESHSRLRFVVEYSLSFGVVCSSGYAQRFSTLICALVEYELQSLLDEQWPDWKGDPCFRNWLAKRESLGVRQVRLHTLKMYTDDAALAAASARMFILLLRAWHRATKKLNLRMAIAAKRFLGTAAIWLGVGFISAAGILFIPKGKILRAVSALGHLRQISLMHRDVLSLLGLLEHLRGVLFGPRRWMWGLWALVQHRNHPESYPEPDEFAIQNIQRWIARLTQGGTVHAIHAFGRKSSPASESQAQANSPLSSLRVRLHLWPDAARQRLVVDRRGLGGWCHGFIFHIPIPPLGMQLLVISVLELLAALVALLTFGSLSTDLQMTLHTDSLTTAYVVTEETGKAPAGQFALDYFHSLPEARGLLERTDIDHTYGEGNVGDLPSRAKWKELADLAAQLGVTVHHAPVPDAALRLVHATLRFEGSRQGLSNKALIALCGDVHPHPGPLSRPPSPPTALYRGGWTAQEIYALQTLSRSDLEQQFQRLREANLCLGRLAGELEDGINRRQEQILELRRRCRSYEDSCNTWREQGEQARRDVDRLHERIRAVNAQVVEFQHMLHERDVQIQGWRQLAEDRYRQGVEAERKHAQARLGRVKEAISRGGLTNAELIALCGDVHPHPGPSALERAKLTLASGMMGAEQGAVSQPRPGPSSLAQTTDDLRKQIGVNPGLPAQHTGSSSLERAAHSLAGQNRGGAKRTAEMRQQSAATSRVELASRSLKPRTEDAKPESMLGSLEGDQRVTFEDLQAQRRGSHGNTGLGKGVYALRPADETLLPRMQKEMANIRREAVNQRTFKKDMGHWNQYWEPVCRLFQTRSIRDAPGAATGSDADAQNADIDLACFALILIMATMQPKKKTAPAAKPQSGFQVLLAIRRIHDLLGVMFVPLKYVRSTLTGLLRRFIRVHGHEALLPDRKWPLPHGHFISLLRLKRIKVGSTYWEAESLLGQSTLAMICLLYAAGFRKAEITDHGGGVTYLTRSSLRWFIKGKFYYEPAAKLLSSLSPGDYVEVWPRQSKCDFTGEVWGDKPTFHHWSPVEGNACAMLAQLEIFKPVRGEDRRTFPLFSENDGSPVSETKAARMLDAMLLCFMPAALAFHYTWHSFRHSLATRLRRAQCPADVIMQLCRWQTIQSLRTYARLDASQQKMWHEASFAVQFTEGASLEDSLDSATVMHRLEQDPTWDREILGHGGAGQVDTPRAANAAQVAPRATTPTRRENLRTETNTARKETPRAQTPLPSLTKNNAVGRTVLVPRTRYPTYACSEHEGTGWEAIILSATGVSAMVKYLHAHTSDGRGYENTREPLNVLTALT